MNNLDEIYNQALVMLKRGHSKQEILLKYPDFAQELSPLIETTLLLIKLPKKATPEPAMQRKYIFISPKRAWLAWLNVSKFAGVSMSAILLISAFGLTAYAAFKSVPGQTLFAVKKSAEKVEFLLAYNQVDKANIQVSIAKQRLSDAQQIFSDPQSNLGQKKAALAELSVQASTAIADVNTVTEKDPNSDKSHPLLNSLEDISNQQRTLLTQIKPDTQIKDVANNALQSLNVDSAKIIAIKQRVAIANKDQTLTELSSAPNSVAILGNITQISGSQITVDKTTFTLNGQTSITDSDGNTLSVTDLNPKLKVNVLGTKNTSGLIAQKILVTTTTTATTTDGQVKGDSTQTASVVDKNATSVVVSLKLSEKSDTNKHSSSTDENSKIDLGTAVGSFISEDPAPQFSGN